MLIDIFDENSSININYKAIQIFGLSTAAYLSLLIGIYKKAIRKNKIEDNYFKVDRSYITKMLKMTNEEQLICDGNLFKTSILKKSPDNPDKIKLDIKLYLSLLASEDIELYEKISKQMKVMHPRGIKESQRQQTIKKLQSLIECSNYELLTALREWVEGVYANPKGFLSKLAIKTFQNTLNNYAQGDLDKALSVVQIATIQGYRDCNWAINVYEKSHKTNTIQNNIPNNNVRVTSQEVASKDELSDIQF